MVDQQRLFFVCYPDTDSTIGGVKQIYRQVELLRRLDVNASILHQSPGFRVEWFNSTACVTDIESFKSLPPDPERDWIIFPETWVKAIPTYLPGFRKVIFNQNAYYTFGLDGSFDPEISNLYHHKDVQAVVTVSNDNAQLLHHSFGLSLDRLHVLVNGIDPELFYPPSVKYRRIAYLPRKNSQDSCVLNLLASRRPALSKYPFLPLTNLSHSQLAHQLRDSLVFLNFGHPEGFGLPLAEAIACGCIVVGYHGLAGRDFCKYALNFVEFGDWLGFVNQLERSVLAFELDPQTSAQKLLGYSEVLLDQFSLTNELDSCRHVWSNILGL